MALAIDANQGTVYKHGTWLWRRRVTPTIVNADRNALFRLPTGTRVLGGVIDVITAATGTTVGGTLNLENNGGDVGLTSSVDLKATGKTRIDEADEGVATVHNASGDPVDVVLDISSTAPANAPLITVGLYVARTNYDKGAT